MEQQINYLTSKTALTESEEQVLNLVGTSLKNKFQQDGTQRILKDFTLNQHQKTARLPKSPCKSAHSTQPQLQTSKIQGKILTKRNIRTELPNYFKEFYSTK
jgi:hypothetical protein